MRNPSFFCMKHKQLDTIRKRWCLMLNPGALVVFRGQKALLHSPPLSQAVTGLTLEFLTVSEGVRASFVMSTH